MFSKIFGKVKSYIISNYKFLLLIIAMFLLFQIELPYIIYKPGGSINLNKRVVVEDGFKSSGSFEMAYVSVVKGSIPFLAFAKIMPNWDIAPKEEIAMDNESIKDALERDRIYLEESIDNATIVAYKLANKKIKLENILNNVIYITEDADTTIKEYDKIISIEGKAVKSLEDIKGVVNSKNNGDILKVVVLRNDKEKECTAKVYKTEDGLKIGVSIVNTYDFITDPGLEIKTKSSESGPSGGLMTALSIYNALIPDDLTKGRKIVGTGTISSDGLVGEIGGVKYKLMGAVKKKADVFLCPKDNYDEAIRLVKDKDYDIKVVSVNTIEDAINYLLK